jgi:hypothetical protein
MKEKLNTHFSYREDGFLVWIKPTSKSTKIGDISGTLSNSKYYMSGFLGKIYLTHRLIYMYHFGEFTGEIDHINRIKTDNRIENLRVVDRSQNCQNKTTINKLGYKGVFKNNKKFNAKSCGVHIGSFDTIEEAALAYNNYVINRFGDKSSLNNI